jgi:hypothetical protein
MIDRAMNALENLKHASLKLDSKFKNSIAEIRSHLGESGVVGSLDFKKAMSGLIELMKETPTIPNELWKALLDVYEEVNQPPFEDVEMDITNARQKNEAKK